MVDLNGQLRLHDDVRFSELLVGADRLPILIVDNFLSNPDVLIEYAAAQGTFEGVSDAFYPGSRAPIPAIYSFAVRAFLGVAIGATFGLSNCSVAGELSHFSLITTAPAKLRPVQRVPHVDNTDSKQIAVLHYLFRADYGGTSFYRHRRTGFEFIDAARSDTYARTLNEELSRLGEPPQRYICGDDPLFERTGSVAAVFNRLIAYRSMHLHSADIAAGFPFSADSRSGRLTANTFYFYR